MRRERAVATCLLCDERTEIAEVYLFLSFVAPLLAPLSAYFLGFFGISFVDTDGLQHSPSTYGLSDLVPDLNPSTSGGPSSTTVPESNKNNDSNNGNDIHPVCGVPKMPTSPSSPNLVSKSGTMKPTAKTRGMIKSMTNPDIASMVKVRLS